MQNKPNFQNDQMNVSNIITSNYKNFIPLVGQKNKPNSNPIAERVKMMQSVYLQRIMKKNAAKGYENQTQSNPRDRKRIKIPYLP